MKDQLRILLVEDDLVEAKAISRAFVKWNAAKHLSHAKDGIEALNLLKTPSECFNIVLLDLNLPRMDGMEFLEHLRNDPALQNTLVFVLTTSDSERDKRESYKFNVAGYFVKSKMGDDFIRLVQLMSFFSLTTEFPPQTNNPEIVAMLQSREFK